jgi:sulfur transfer protein SufE
MVPTEELWQHASKYYRGTKTDFDGRYKHYIANGAQLPVYVAVGQNGRIKITGGEDLVWFARKAGAKELPVFFSYQKQV